MSNKFSIIGGDSRIVELAIILAKEKNTVYTYGLENANKLNAFSNISFEENLGSALEKGDYIISSVPFSSNGIEVNTPFSNQKIKVEDLFYELGSKILFAGAISKEVANISEKYDVKIIDLMKQEDLTIFNTIATAEGTIEIAISNTRRNIQGSNVLVLGFGRVAKVVAQKFKALDAKVTCAARKKEDKAWIQTYGYEETDINNLGSNLSNYDIIINTVPVLILTKERLDFVKNDALLIDLASKPGGVDQEYAKDKGLNSIWALALPGKVAPVSSAEFIYSTILSVLN